jgi:3-hydroxyacyl-CoA dehydrogenase
MKYKFHHSVVIGAGTMGAAIAAHLANAGVPVTLLDIIPNKLLPEEEKKGLTLQDKVVRNRIVQQGLDRAIKSRPASFFTTDTAALVTIGNLEDDLEVIKSTDWVIEVIIENLKIKRSLMARIDAIRPASTIVSTNTSGIPVTEIAEGLSEGFRQHFLGTHFFNPPRYLKLLEVIPTKDTLPEVIDAVSEFGEYRLGKGIVLCKDTPNFIANRIGFGGGAFALDYILENSYTVDEVDTITGPAIGRPKTATFRLIDLVGIDVWEDVGANLAPAIPDDKQAQQYLNSTQANQLIHSMVEKGWLGTKVKQGFYKEVRTPEGNREFWTLNLKTMDYEAPVKVRFESIGKVKDVEDLGEKLKTIITSEDRAGQLVRALTYQGLYYASLRIPEIADTPKPLDDAMRWGFGHVAGPFETWDMLGVKETLPAMVAAGFPVADWVENMVSSGHPTFYQYETGTKVGVYNPGLGKYVPIKRPASLVLLKEQKVVSKNPGATLFDLGDGVACVEFHTKVNALDDDIFNMILEAQDRTLTDFEGLVIGNEAENFCAGGANIMMVVMAAQMGLWDQLESSVKKMQDMNMRSRYFPKPVVVAPAGVTLGGGLEITMYSSRVVALSELYTGATEFAVGVIPAGGGTKEMLRRIVNPAMKTESAEALPFLQRVFMQIGLAKVSMSAEEARQMGIIGPSDRVVMNKDILLAEAKKEVLHMAATGYHPPLPEKVYAAGRDALGALRVAIHMMTEGKYITEYESHMAGKLAVVMTGGELSRPTWVDEQYILDLEREAFISLCGEEKTRQRMVNMLQTGKPLRN